MLGRFAAVGSILVLTVVLLSSQQPVGSRFLFVWAGDKDRVHNDFLAVVDVAPSHRRTAVLSERFPLTAKGFNRTILNPAFARPSAVCQWVRRESDIPV